MSIKRRSYVFVVFLIAVLFAMHLPGAGDSSPAAAQRLQPSDFIYLGAFRLPGGDTPPQTWGWGGFAMTYYPGGDPSGSNDGYPGSLYAAGHAWEHQVSEFSIPVPVISATKNVNELNAAGTLQGFTDIFNVSSLEIPRTGLAYLPKQGSQTSGKLHMCWGEHMQNEGDLTHGWCELNLSNPQVKRSWYLNVPYNIYNTNDLLFDIPTAWAASNTPGKLLATGRYRDGGWSGQGPSLFAIGPWSQGNPPAHGTSLQNVTLLRYTSSADPDSWDEATNHTMTDYHHSDEWSGASWITAGNKAAVVFVGTKGTGDCWYGDSNGPCYDCEGERGWWSTGFEGRFIFYDPDDLARVASGAMESHEPQPYAYLNVDQHLYHIESTQQWYHLGAACFDRAGGYFYVMEPYVDNDKPIVHVWKVTGDGSGGGDEVIALTPSRLNFGAVVGGASSGDRTVTVANTGSGTMNWSAADDVSWLSVSPAGGTNAGVVTVSVNASGMSAGTYNGTVSVSSADASNSPQTAPVTLTVYNAGSTAPPFGEFATPADGAEISSSVPFTGWVLDDVGVDSVKIYRMDGGSPVYIGDAVFVPGARGDVEAAYPYYPDNHKAGWGYMMLTNFLPNSGNGGFTIIAIAEDKEGHSVTLGSKTVTVDNANAVKPFGAIDYPQPGATVSGSSYRNHGWALTPPPNEIPTDGSTIEIYIDGVGRGAVNYNIYRSDIYTLFPGYVNSDGAGGYFDIDTTAYANGLHTIAWSVVDGAGNTDGIGSRYFAVQNIGDRGQGIGVREKQNAGRPVGAWSPRPDLEPTPVIVKRGFNRHAVPEEIHPGENGIITIEIKELERLELHLPPDPSLPLTPYPLSLKNATREYRGYTIVGNQLSALPIGSTLDPRGVFSWQPGVGFVGHYDFVFVGADGEKRLNRRVKISIVPGFNVKEHARDE